MDEKNELNDIILNKGSSTSGSRKIILAVATLGIILVVVIMLMSTMSPDAKEKLPQPIPIPKKEVATKPPSIPAPATQEVESEPLFEEVEVVDEMIEESNKDLDEIAQRLKQESMEVKIIEAQKALEAVKKEQETVKKQIATKKHSPVKKQTKAKKTIKTKKALSTKKVTKKAPNTKKIIQKTSTSKAYYVQVGSFQKYKPNKKFLNSITKQGYNYKFHKVTRNNQSLNKVLVGPFNSEKEARSALKILRKNIEAGAFLLKL